MTATIRVRALTTGNSYALLRYNTYSSVPTSGYLSSAYDALTVFTAANTTHNLTDTFMSDKIVIYRCVPYTTAGEPFIAGLDASGTAVRIWFDTTSGKHYAVEWRNSLTSGSWSSLTNNVPGTGGPIFIADPDALAQPRRFYRMIETTSP